MNTVTEISIETLDNWKNIEDLYKNQWKIIKCNDIEMSSKSDWYLVCQIYNKSEHENWCSEPIDNIKYKIDIDWNKLIVQ